ASALRRSLVGEDEVVVCGGGTAHVRKVAIGNRGEQGVEIKDGLQAGELVVGDHVLGLQEHQPLVARRQTTTGRAKPKADDEDNEDDQPAHPKTEAAKTTEGNQPGEKGSNEK